MAPVAGWASTPCSSSHCPPRSPWASLAGLAPGILLVAYGAVILAAPRAPGVLFVVAGALLIIFGALLAIGGWGAARVTAP